MFYLKCTCDTWTANCKHVIHDLICGTFKLRFGNQFITMSPSENIMLILVLVMLILFLIYLFGEVRAKLHKNFKQTKNFNTLSRFMYVIITIILILLHILFILSCICRCCINACHPTTNRFGKTTSLTCEEKIIVTLGKMIPHYTYINRNEQTEEPTQINTQLTSILKKSTNTKVEFDNTENDSVFDNNASKTSTINPKKSQVFYHSSVTSET